LPPAELLLIRHAPVLADGRLAGRRDVAAVLPDAAVLAAVRALAGPVDRVIASPARRCRATAAALWPEAALVEDARLWEQDFGAWEGLPFADLPDLGDLAPAALAGHAPPGGESFADLCARTAPALEAWAALPGRSALVAHAGTVRAALALALGAAAPALAFRIDPLSLTRLQPCGGQGWAVGGVNLVAAC